MESNRFEHCGGGSDLGVGGNLPEWNFRRYMVLSTCEGLQFLGAHMRCQAYSVCILGQELLIYPFITESII